jgi:hypothetical protein
MLDSIIAAVDFGADVFKSHPAELVEHSLVWITAIFALLNQLRDEPTPVCQAAPLAQSTRH